MIFFHIIALTDYVLLRLIDDVAHESGKNAIYYFLTSYLYYWQYVY